MTQDSRPANIQKLDALTMNKDPMPELVALLDSCWHCKRPKEEHANGQCLFGSTQYANYGRMFKMLSDVWFMQREFPSIPREKP